MFLTDASYGLPLQVVPNEWMWRAVKIAVRTPWFRLSYLVLPEEFEDQMLLCSANELRNAIAKLGQDDSIKLLNVDLISPPWMNGTDRWRMDPLIRIDVGTLKGNSHLVFVLEGGGQYSDFTETTGPIKLKGKKTFVEVPSLSA